METVKIFLSGVSDVANKIFSVVTYFLPVSPFRDLVIPGILAEIMGYVNYYVPFSGMVSISEGWISCVLIFYAYKIILRKVSAIK
jgi:hypothetical protein